ncbi:MAG: PASTA domain-containing protein [Acidimicrobiaceae bacterium]|nr:PASTA domain-containing protein [Acidimicrobiaceae bacterium]
MTTVMVASMVMAPPVHVGAVSGHAPVHVPRLVGLSKARVFALMRADGLYFVTRGPGSSDGKWVSVVAQSPAAGVVVAWHSQIVLTTTTQSPTGPRRVPRLVGLSKAQVFSAMRRASLYFVTVGPGSSTGHWVVALHQSPPAGTLVKWHSQVVVSVSTHRPLVKALVKISAKPKPKPKKKPVIRSSPAATTSTTSTIASTTTTYPGETTTTAPTTTTSTTVPVTTTTVKKRPVRYRVGIATWYNDAPGYCATWYLPMGTRVTIRDLATGRSVHCVVNDREASHGNRVVDLAESQFSQLAPLAQGVILVRVTW